MMTASRSVHVPDWQTLILSHIRNVWDVYKTNISLVTIVFQHIENLGIDYYISHMLKFQNYRAVYTAM